MNAGDERARRPRGTPAGGQFAARRRPEADLDLDEPRWEQLTLPGMERTLDLSTTHSEVMELLDPTLYPVETRRSMARSFRPGVAEVVSRDPHPAVRQMAFDGWDLSEGSFERIINDDDTVRARLLAAPA